MNKWYFKTSALVFAFLCLGPLALPLLWFNSRFSVIKKVVVTGIVLVLSYFTWIWVKHSLEVLYDNYKKIF